MVTSSLPASAQSWHRTFGGPGNEHGWIVLARQGDGFAIGGNTDSFGAGGDDMYLIATDTTGVEDWHRTFGGEYRETSFAVLETSDGGYLLNGTTEPVPSLSHLLLVKTGVDGVEEWSRTYGTAGNLYLFGHPCIEASDGGYLVAANELTWSPFDQNIYFLKVDSNGNKEWDRTYGGPNFETCTSVLRTPDGGYIIGASTAPMGSGGSIDTLLVKTDSVGNEQWTQTYGGPGTDLAGLFASSPEGGFVLAGQTDSFGSGLTDFWLIKTDATGGETLSRTYGGAADDSDAFLLEAADGGYLLVGETESFGSGGEDIYAVKTDADGNEQWSQTYGGHGTDQSSGALQTADGGYAISGVTDSFGAGSNDVYLVKVDAVGNEQWSQTFGGTADEYASVQLQTDNGYVLVGSTASFGAGSNDVWLIYHVPTGPVDTDGDGMPDWWESLHFGGPTNALPNRDQDGDHMSNLAEFVADTIPTNGDSFLGLTALAVSNGNVIVHWQGGILATQLIERCQSLTLTGDEWLPVLTNFPPTPVSTNWTDVTSHTHLFYRIKASR